MTISRAFRMVGITATSALIAGIMLAATAATNKPDIDLKVDRLSGSMRNLAAEDRKVVDEAIELIQRGENLLAFGRLSSLSKKNSENSSVRVLTAYVQLQLGNALGAFDEAKKAESAKDHNTYACWFLAKVALLTGNPATCRRELGHLKAGGDMPTEAVELEQELHKHEAKLK